MDEETSCQECKVPLYMTREHSWLSSGAIVQARQTGNRVAFFESDCLDPLFTGIGTLIGMPIEPVVAEASRRETRSYMDRLVPDEAKELLSRPGVEPLQQAAGVVSQVARIMGYGNFSLLEVRNELDGEDCLRYRYTEPYSVPLLDGNIAGTTEALTGRTGRITREVLPDSSKETAFLFSDVPEEPGDRPVTEIYRPRAGDVELRKCPSCGGPAELSRYKWDLDRGMIRSVSRGRRMAVVGPAMIDPIFKDLELKLGDIIPEIVVEALRRFVRGGYYSSTEVRSESLMRDLFALRGLGEIVELKTGRKGAVMRLRDSAMHLTVVGIAQGLFELAFGEESKVEWERHADGALEIEVAPWN